MYYFNIFLNKKYFKKINNNRIPALNHLSKPDQLNTKKKRNDICFNKNDL
jgi:hypothetical protein